MASRIFEQWEEGDITGVEAARLLMGDLAEAGDAFKAMEERKDELRNELSQVIARTGKQEFKGLGRVYVSEPSVRNGYDIKKLEKLVTELGHTDPIIAALIIQCRTTSVTAGSLRVEKER